jgi:hypothetical protein
MLSSFTPTSTRNSRVMITGGDGVDATEIVSRANQKFFMVGRESILRRASGRHAETGKRVCILPREPIPEQLARFENVGHRLKICFTSTSGAAGVERHKLGESLSALSSNPCPHAGSRCARQRRNRGPQNESPGSTFPDKCREQGLSPPISFRDRWCEADFSTSIEVTSKDTQSEASHHSLWLKAVGLKGRSLC